MASTKAQRPAARASSSTSATRRQRPSAERSSSAARRASPRGSTPPGPGRGSSRSTSRPRQAERKSGNRSVPDAEPRLVRRVGPLEIDVPRSLGYFGGIALAVTAGLIDPPLGLFIAAVPLIKMADLPKLPNLPRFAAQIFEGVAKPVGGDSEGTVRLVSGKGTSDSPVSSD